MLDNIVRCDFCDPILPGAISNIELERTEASPIAILFLPENIRNI